MMHVPAICKTCGTLFPSGFVVEDSTNIWFGGNESGPCPRCGGVGRVVDGLFDFIGDSIRVLAAPQQTVDVLSRLKILVEDAQMGHLDKAQFEAAVEREVPELAPVVRRLLVPQTPSDFYGFLAVLLAVLSILLGSKQQVIVNQDVDVDVHIDKVIERCLQEDSHPRPPGGPGTPNP